MESQRRFPLNAPGDFYVLDGMCIACSAPEAEAPGLIAHDDTIRDVYHCYFKRQPTSAEEREHAIMAVRVCCCGSVRYGGKDPSVLERLSDVPDSCDHQDLFKPRSGEG